MNEWLRSLGLVSWKPVVSAALLPPLLPLLVGLLGCWYWRRRPRLGLTLVLGSLLGLWLLATPAFSLLLLRQLTQPPAPLSATQRAALVRAPHTAIVVLGAGRIRQTPEYDHAPDLKPMTLNRLRHGIWLARQTALPVLYSGGIGFGAAPGDTEGAAARLVAQRDFGLPLRWVEDRSRDTHENGLYSVALLREAGIRQVVLVTHDYHQRRALRNFERAAAAQQWPLQLVPAPVGVREAHARELTDWLPTAEGLERSWLALHEWLGWLAGA